MSIVIGLNLLFITYFLIVHWLADFVFLWSWMHNKKHYLFYAITSHSCIYTIFVAFSIFITIGFSFDLFIKSAFVLFMTHVIIDLIFSKVLSNKCLSEYLRYVVIGFEQILHITVLFAVVIFNLKNV